MKYSADKFQKAGSVVLVPSSIIRSNPDQPRKSFRKQEIDALCVSVRQIGIIQPILVRYTDNNDYELISGERRLRACKMAGLSSIPSIIIEINDERSALLAVIENLQRENLHFFEEAVAIERLIKGFGLSQEEVARRLGKSQSTLSNKLRILRLPDEIRYNIMIFGLTERHARALLRLPSTELMEQVIDTIVEQGLTVSATEQLICDILTKSASKERKGKKVMVFKDIRIFINTLNHAVTTMRKSGINAKATKNETEEYIEYTVKISKPVNT